MTYEEALTYVNSVSWMGSKPGLSRIRELMDRLGNPERQTQYIHIVGTNGKGSTAVMLQSVLTRAGYRTGLFTTPHLISFRERMRIDGEMISEDAFGALTEQVRLHAQAMADKPTEFELVTALALTWFAREGCDLVVLEAGMGGALDATNVIPAPLVAVITNLGLDHTDYLGGTVEEIAAAKAGIVKPGCRCVYYPNIPSVERVLLAACETQGVRAYRAPVEKLVPISEDLTGQTFAWAGETWGIPLLGDHQLGNAAVALQALECLEASGRPVSKEAIRKGLAEAVWPARFQVLRQEPPVILDGGHNPQCIRAMADTLERVLPGRRFTVLTGVLADKDYREMYKPLLPLAERIITVTPNSPRALPAYALAAWLEQTGKPVTWCETVAQGLKAALETGGPVLVCGSLYLAGELLELSNTFQCYGGG